MRSRVIQKGGVDYLIEREIVEKTYSYRLYRVTDEACKKLLAFKSKALFTDKDIIKLL